MNAYLPKLATTKAEVERYMRTRAKQLAGAGYTPCSDLYPIDGGYALDFKDHAGLVFSSFYIMKQFHGMGHARKFVEQCKQQNRVILTMTDCGIGQFLWQQQALFRVANGITETSEYQAVSEFYSDREAKRSRVRLMNHIDEGIAILHRIGAAEEAKLAFALHPLLQADDDLATNFHRVCQISTPYVIGLAMEYRNQANQWLSDKVSVDSSGVTIHGMPSSGPLEDVRSMLIADKVQNYKDFIAYHQATHPRSIELNTYFLKWLSVLGITESKYQELVKDL